MVYLCNTSVDHLRWGGEFKTTQSAAQDLAKTGQSRGLQVELKTLGEAAICARLPKSIGFILKGTAMDLAMTLMLIHCMIVYTYNIVFGDSGDWRQSHFGPF